VVGAGHWAWWAAALAPADEVVIRRLMTFLHAQEDRAAALRAYEAYASRLKQEYELEPSPETRALAEALRLEDPRSSAEVAVQVPSAGGKGGTPERHRTRRRRWVATELIAATLVAGLGYGVVTRRRAGDTPPAVPRIVVLPFQNLGPAEDAYFADGISDEITARLAMVRGLRVIGGQSALHYKGTDKTPRQVAGEVGADYVLVGTVSWQRSARGAGRVRVRPQLIQARDETQVWATVLDQDATDLFPLLSAIALRVVEEMRVTMEAPQRTRLSGASTTSPEAYDYYLRGRELVRRTWTESNFRTAISMFERAVAIDSNFALAYAWLSFAHTDAYWLLSLGPEQLRQADSIGEKALRLDPQSPDAHMALGFYYYVCCEDYDRALSHLETSHARRPGDAQVVMFIGNVHKRRGRWDAARRYYEEAADLDPRWYQPLLNLAQLQLWLHRYDDAERTSKRALALEPREGFAYEIWASAPLLRDGDIAAARRVLVEAARVSDGFVGMRLPFTLELLDRNYRAALGRILGKMGALNITDEWLVSDHNRRAVAFRLLGDSAAARTEFDSARTELLAEVPRGYPRNRGGQNWLRSGLAISYAGLGQRQDALEQVRLITTSDPVAWDAISGPVTLQNLALAYVLLGDNTAALDILERLVAIPARLSPQTLHLDPLWDPLRGDPRFQRLVHGGR
jgi:TolB-like protein